MTHHGSWGDVNPPGETLVRSEEGGGTGVPGEGRFQRKEVVGLVVDGEAFTGYGHDVEGAVLAEVQSQGADAGVYDRRILR